VPYFFFLPFLSTFFGALATLLTSKLQLASICIYNLLKAKHSGATIKMVQK